MTAFCTAAEIGEAITKAHETLSGIDFVREVAKWRLEAAWKYPSNPYSDEYHAVVLRHFEEISGKPYAAPAANESFAVPMAHLAAPFPHCTSDADEVSRYLFGVANIIRVIPNRAPARIMEFGSGWGHVAFNLAQMGHDVTAVDINLESAELLRERARRNEVRLAIRNAGYLDVEFEPGSMDVAVFFESFHHCHRPFELIARLERWLTPSGLLVFAGEPFYPGFHAPWDVRIDGQSIWAARDHGWLELGFEESFFVRMLFERGWVVRKRSLDVAGAYGVMHLATRHEGEFVPGETFFPPNVAATWAPHDGTVASPYRWTAGASLLPLDSRPQWRKVIVTGTNFNPRDSIWVQLSCGPHRASRSIAPGETAEIALDLPADRARELRIDSPTWVPRNAGVNDDSRTLGVAVGGIRYETS